MRNKEITRNNIIEAAEKVFAEKGYWGARVDQIAEEAQANKRMLYFYFGNKEELYAEVLRIVYSRLAGVEKSIDANMHPEKAVEAFIRAYFEFLHENENFVKLVMWENLNEAKFIDSSGAGNIKNDSVRLLKNILKKGVQEGIFKSDTDEDEIIFAMNMFVFSYFSNSYTMPKMIGIDLKSKKNTEKRIKMVTEMILSQIRK